MAEDSTDKNLITVDQAAALLMISPAWVRQLADKGYCPKASKSKVPLVGMVQGYVRWLKDENTRNQKSVAQSEVQRERALEIRLRRERDAGVLVEVAQAEEVFADVLGTLRADLTGVPAASTRDLELRKVIEQRINDAIIRSRDKYEKQVAAIRAGSDLPLDDKTTTA